MTQQVPDWFEYRDNVYCLVGIAGGDLISADDLGLKFGPGGSTASYRGYTITYGVDKKSCFVIRHIDGNLQELKQVNGVAPVQNEYGGWNYLNVDYPVELTGYVLFSDIATVHSIYLCAGEASFPVYEAQVISGQVIDIRDCLQEIENRLKQYGEKPERPCIHWNTSAVEQLKSVQAEWDWTTTFLPRRYDVLNAGIMSYFPYRHVVEELRLKVASEANSADKE